MNSNLAYRPEICEELINGEVVAMSPWPGVNHNVISENIIYIFKQHLRGKKCAPFGVPEYWIVDPANQTIEI